MAKNKVEAIQMDLPVLDDQSVPDSSELPIDRYDIIYYVRADYCNPNGDPDMDNMPRVDPHTGKGLMSPQSLKRRIRDQIERIVAGVRFGKLQFDKELDQGLTQALNPNLSDTTRGYYIYSQTLCNLKLREQYAKALYAQVGGDIKKAPREKLLCKYFYDVRAFGAVITKSGEDDDSGGQLIGPVQVSFGWSLKPVDVIKVTCTGPSRDDPGIKGLEEILDPEQVLEEERKLRETNSSKNRTMGRSYVVNDAVYRFQISISPQQAWNTGFNGTDLALLLVALKRWPDWWKTYTKTGMRHVRAFVFKHSSKYGNMPIWEIQEKLDAVIAEKGLEKIEAEDLKDITDEGIQVFII